MASYLRKSPAGFRVSVTFCSGCPSLGETNLIINYRTYGDYYFTLWGLILTLFGTFLAAVKTIYTNVLQSSRKPSGPPSIPGTWRHRHPLGPHTDGSSLWSSLSSIARSLVPPRLDLHPLDLLTRMSPLAFVQCVIYAQLSGELDRLRHFGIHDSHMSAFQGVMMPHTHASTSGPANITDTWSTASLYNCLHTDQIRVIGGVTLSQALVLLLNAVIAFGLNVVSFSANGKVGPLSMTVAGKLW